MAAYKHKCGYTDTLINNCPIQVKKLDPKKVIIEIIGNEDKAIDSGAKGSIFNLKLNDNNAILKIFKSNHKDLISREICNQEVAAGHNISPHILDYWFCEEDPLKGAIIMENAGNMNFQDFIDQKSLIKIESKTDLIDALQIINAFLSLYFRLYVLNYIAKIFHRDLHLKNMMVSVDSNGFLEDLKIIDFGESEFSENIFSDIQKIISNTKDINEKNFLLGKFIKTIYADELMYVDFFVDRYIRKTQGLKPENHICELFYNKFIVEYIYNKFTNPTTSLWDIDTELIDNQIDAFRGDVSEFIEKNFGHLFKITEDNSLYVNSEDEEENEDEDDVYVFVKDYIKLPRLVLKDYKILKKKEDEIKKEKMRQK